MYGDAAQLEKSNKKPLLSKLEDPNGSSNLNQCCEYKIKHGEGIWMWNN